MNTVTQAFDSRAMLLSEPSTAPSAFSLWRWLGDRLAAKASRQQEAALLRDQANELMSVDSRFASNLRAAADRYEESNGH